MFVLLILVKCPSPLMVFRYIIYFNLCVSGNRSIFPCTGTIGTSVYRRTTTRVGFHGICAIPWVVPSRSWVRIALLAFFEQQKNNYIYLGFRSTLYRLRGPLPCVRILENKQWGAYCWWSGIAFSLQPAKSACPTHPIPHSEIFSSFFYDFFLKKLGNIQDRHMCFKVHLCFFIYLPLTPSSETVLRGRI